MQTTKDLNIKVLKFDELFTLRRKELKKHSWFSFPNDLLLHPDFDEITGPELKWFIWIISVCSKCNTDKIRLSVRHAARKLDLELSSLESMVEKLKMKQIQILTDEEMCKKNENIDQSHSGATAEPLQNRTEQDNTEHNITDSQAENSVFDLKSFKENKTLWPIMKNFNPEIVQMWCNEYDFAWLNNSLAKGVRWHIKNKNAKINDSGPDWTDRLDRWLGNEKNPLKRTNKAIEEAFFANLNTENPKHGEMNHD